MQQLTHHTPPPLQSVVHPPRLQVLFVPLVGACSASRFRAAQADNLLKAIIMAWFEAACPALPWTCPGKRTRTLRVVVIYWPLWRNKFARESPPIAGAGNSTLGLALGLGLAAGPLGPCSGAMRDVVPAVFTYEMC